MRFTSAALVLSLAVQCLSGLTHALMLLPDTCWYMEYMETRFYFILLYTFRHSSAAAGVISSEEANRAYLIFQTFIIWFQVLNKPRH